MKTAFSAMVLMGLIMIAGCTQGGPSAATCNCPAPGSWSECNDSAVKTRINYQCGSETNYTCVPYNETAECETSITITSEDLTVVISPSLDSKVKGTIKIEATNIPSQTTKIYFMMNPQNEPINVSEGLKDNQVFTIDDATPSKGWSKYIDTTAMSNGVYEIAVLPTYEGAPSNSPWLAIAKTQVVISN